MFQLCDKTQELHTPGDQKRRCDEKQAGSGERVRSQMKQSALAVNRRARLDLGCSGFPKTGQGMNSQAEGPMWLGK